MAEERPPPLADTDDDASLSLDEDSDADGYIYTVGEDDNEDDDDYDDGEDEEEAYQARAQSKQKTTSKKDNDGPPPLRDSSGSDGPPSPGAEGAAARKKSSAGGTSAGGRSGSSSSASGKSSLSRKNDKAPAAAGPVRKDSSPAAPAPPLWVGFEKSRQGAERLGLGLMKKWETFVEAKAIPRPFTSWYAGQVMGNRSVPNALNVPGLPRGFPEFCHWVADGHHKACGVPLRQGFACMAEQFVKQVRAGDASSRLTKSNSHNNTGKNNSSGQRAGGLGGGSPGGAGSTALSSSRGLTGRSASSGYIEEPPIFGHVPGAADAPNRNRERRIRKGFLGLSNESDMVAKMKSALAGAGSQHDDDLGNSSAGSTAAGRATNGALIAGQQVSEQLRHEAEDLKGLDAADILGPASADSKVPVGTSAMVASLRRARAYRRRGERQARLLERELELCLTRMAYIEERYRLLEAETEGRESPLGLALNGAETKLQTAKLHLNDGQLPLALHTYDLAVKGHVTDSPGRRKENAEMKKARETIGKALLGRSLCHFLVGDLYSGKTDAEQANFIWPNKPTRDHQAQSTQFHEKQQRLNMKTSEWKVSSTL